MPVLVLGTDGTLRAYDPESGDQTDETELMDPPGSGASAPTVRVDTGRAYVNDPAADAVYEIDYNDDPRLARNFDFGFRPELVIQTGWGPLCRPAPPADAAAESCSPPCSRCCCSPRSPDAPPSAASAPASSSPPTSAATSPATSSATRPTSPCSCRPTPTRIPSVPPRARRRSWKRPNCSSTTAWVWRRACCATCAPPRMPVPRPSRSARESTPSTTPRATPPGGPTPTSGPTPCGWARPSASSPTRWSNRWRASARSG